MSRSPIRRILLPAAIVSTSIFALMMMGVTCLRSLETMAQDRSTYSAQQTVNWVLPTERDNHRIRQAGIALIVSVGGGLLTVEGLRRWYAFRQSAQTRSKQLGLEEFFQETNSPSDEFSP